MFPPHDEFRVKRLISGYVIELCKGGQVHTRLFDTVEGPPGARRTVARVLELTQVSEWTGPRGGEKFTPAQQFHRGRSR